MARRPVNFSVPPCADLDGATHKEVPDYVCFKILAASSYILDCREIHFLDRISVHSCPKQPVSPGFPQSNPLICSSVGGHQKTRSTTARASCPGHRLARRRGAEARKLLKHGAVRASRDYSLGGRRLRPFIACPKRDWRKAVLDKTVLFYRTNCARRP